MSKPIDDSILAHAGVDALSEMFIRRARETGNVDQM